MTERQMIERDTGLEWDDENLPLVKFVEDLQKALEAIPPEYRASAFLHLRGHDWNTGLDVRYMSPETDEEMERRAAWRARDLERERREYERLKAKFEGSSQNCL